MESARKLRRLASTSSRQSKRSIRPQLDLSNSGSGLQHNNLSSGNQYNNSSTGTQYNAASISFGTKEKDDFLAGLRVTDPRDDKVRIQRTKGNLLKDSYRWILDHDDFHQWRADKRLLWVKGGPGKGKTMLLCGVIDELFAMGYKSTFFFFCQAPDARLNTATSVLRGLLYLILDQHPILLDLLRSKYVNLGVARHLFEDVNSWDVLCRMLLSAVSHESMHEVVLVIDALDECTADLDKLISFIIDLTAHVKVIVSSRPDLSIDRGLSAALEDTKIYLALELNEIAISAAVNHYIYHKAEKLAMLKKFDQKTKIRVREYLVANANNTFLWVALVCDQLADNSISNRHTERVLHEFPPGLDSLYDKILTRTLKSLDADDCKEVLSVLSVMSRPPDLAELALLLDGMEHLSEIVEECSSLLFIREGVVYFVHQSAKDFLVRHAGRIMSSDIGGSHDMVLSKLLQAMSNTLRRNIYDIRQHGTSIEEVWVPSPNPLSPVRYACGYWAYHIMYDDDKEANFDPVYSFIAHHFLHWLEALSLLRCMSEGILCMTHVNRMIEASMEPPERKLLVQDALRFIRYFRAPVETDPMQAYLSALVFSPTNSLIRGLFQAEEPKWPLKPMVNADWSTCLQTLEGHTRAVCSVNLSTDQALLVSASQDCTVRLWNTATGHCVQTLSAIDAVSYAAFSANGTFLASASHKVIEVWNTMTGDCIQRLDTHSRVLALAFLGDGYTLASCSTADAVQIWDVRSGKCTRLNADHAICDHAVSAAFSGDGSLVALAGPDDTKVLQINTGSCITTIEYQRPASVAFSQDGASIALLSARGVKTFNLTTGYCFDLLSDGLSDDIDAVAVSYDGKRLALGFQGGSIEVWDTIKKRRRRRMKGHYGLVRWITFNEDGSFLASASSDTSIKLWDLTMHQSSTSLQSPESTTDTWSNPGLILRISGYLLGYLNTLSSSIATNQQNAPGSGLVTTSKAVQPTLENQHREGINSLHLACAGSHLISLSPNRACVWNTETGQCIQKVQGGGRYYMPGSCSATFCNGHVHIAENFETTIEVRDETTGKRLKTLELRNKDGDQVFSSYEGPYELALRPKESDRPVEWVEFSASGYELLTNLGTIDLKKSGEILLKPSATGSPSRSPKAYDYSRDDKSWILKDGRRFLWLPTEYRPDVAVAYGSTIAMGFKSGRVNIMRFS